ncbi:protein LOL2 [Capsella rubella]|nr:protein LOL2 [Capsella rubella]
MWNIEAFVLFCFYGLVVKFFVHFYFLLTKVNYWSTFRASLTFDIFADERDVMEEKKEDQNHRKKEEEEEEEEGPPPGWESAVLPPPTAAAVNPNPTTAEIPEMAQMVCGSCRRLLSYLRGSKRVKCSCCHTLNLVLEANQVGQVNCNNCKVLLMYPYGAPAVRCSSCNSITDIRENNKRSPWSEQQGPLKSVSSCQVSRES